MGCRALLYGLLAGVCLLASVQPAFAIPSGTSLVSAWQMQSSAVATSNGNEISQSSYPADGWYDVTVPCTVIGGLLENGVYDDPFYGLNMLQIRADDFAVPWWYRTTFQLAPLDLPEGSRAILTFNGISYKAGVWINGIQVLTDAEMVGTFRIFDLDITKFLSEDSPNVVALAITRPKNNWSPPSNDDVDLALSFVDWNPYAPDNSMGIWQRVELRILAASSVAVRYPLVDSVVDSVSLAAANLTVTLEVENFGPDDVTGVLSASIDGIGQLSQTVTVPARSVMQVSFRSADNPVLQVANPRLWWPFQMGAQEMYALTSSFDVNGMASATLTAKFGIRQVTSELSPEQYRLFRINGKPIMVAGAGYAPDLFLRVEDFRQLSEFVYWRDMGINAVRLEGKMQNEEFYELADQFGILMMPGWCCCDSWQHWDDWGDEQYVVASESVRSQVKRLRIHPSMLAFFYSSDELPPLDVEQMYLDAFEAELWPNPTLSSAANFTSSITGPSGVKMSGPYVWEPPNYWLEDTIDIVYPGGAPLGGAFGFLSEGGPGASPMTIESLARTIPEAKLWPINFFWDYHCGNQQGLFGSLEYFTPPLDARYGSSSSAEEYALKAQVASYESHRAMYEAYTRNKYTSTGVIHWMLNNAFPSNIWHLYDYYLDHGGAYFGTKTALEPIHLMYSYHDQSIWVVNNRYVEVDDLVAEVEVYGIDSDLIYSTAYPSVNGTGTFSVAADGAVQLLTLPSMDTGPVFIIHLSLSSGSATVSDSVYWYSAQEDVMDWNDSNYYQTPVSTFADMSPLQGLAAAPVTFTPATATPVLSGPGGDYVVDVTVTNAESNGIAFFIQVQALDASGNMILPCVWSDNYFTLMSGATKALTVVIPGYAFPGGGEITFAVKSWNDLFN